MGMGIGISIICTAIWIYKGSHALRNLSGLGVAEPWKVSSRASLNGGAPDPTDQPSTVAPRQRIPSQVREPLPCARSVRRRSLGEADFLSSAISHPARRVQNKWVCGKQEPWIHHPDIAVPYTVGGMTK